MKKFKKAFSLMTVVMMIFCMNVFSVNVSASEYTITVSKPVSSDVSIAGQTFNAYKVFSLTYSGDNYSYTADGTCLDEDYTEVASSVGASDVAGILTALDTEANARKFADAVYNAYIKDKTPAVAGTATVAADAETATIDVSEAGYFLVFGTGTNPDGADGKNTVTSLVMLDTTDKTASIEVKVDAPSISKEIKHNETDSWGNVGDNQIGDTVEYRFISDIPYNVANFSGYDYIIHDTMTAGLTFNETSVKVYKDEGKTSQLADSYVTVTRIDAQNFTVKIDVLAAVNAGDLSADDTLYTYYSATLNTSALVAGSTPDSANHNDNTVYLEYSNNPYDTTSKGQTTTTQVYDWTFTFTVNKIDGNTPANPLANAVFNIKEGDTVLTFSSTETNVYVVDPSGTITDIKTDSTGKFVIKGLDDETEYTLSEKTPPDGYNKAEDTVFSIKSGYNTDGSQLTSLSATIGGTAGQPLSVNVINNSGSKLVGTGGIGTTIFYVSGGILMIVAVVLLITKKRMNK